ncbi:MAG: DUF421 domain-containing protein [Anaerotruncus sp.]|nr:MAG: DUF421 domain-containing protein [Anaerotruncus sp.]
METNGTVSVLQKAEESPVTPKQLSLSVDENFTPVPAVTDGKPTPEYFGENQKSSSAKSNCLLKRAAVKCTK